MHIELVQSLRCIEPHEGTWLVAGIERMSGRHVVEGMLGCPICRAEYVVLDGVAYFGVEPHTVSAAGAASPRAEDDVLRAAALLGLTEPGRTVVLAGEWARVAPQLVEITGSQALAVNPPVRIPEDERISVLFARRTLPLLPGSVHGVALDAESEQLLGSISSVHALKPDGRLVLPAHLPTPDEIRELARDDRHCVGERQGGGPKARVPLKRAGKPGG